MIKGFNGYFASFLQLIIMGREKKSLSHPLGKITTWKVDMSSQPDAEKGGNPSLCRRKGGRRLSIRMLQALQRYMLHWDKSAKVPWCFFAPPSASSFWGTCQQTSTLPFSILNPSLLLCSPKVRLVLLGHLATFTLVCSRVNKQRFCFHLYNAH